MLLKVKPDFKFIPFSINARCSIKQSASKYEKVINQYLSAKPSLKEENNNKE
jgi:hypothetical protein